MNCTTVIRRPVHVYILYILQLEPSKKNVIYPAFQSSSRRIALELRFFYNYDLGYRFI